MKYKNRKLITVECDFCKNPHEKPESEYLRNVKMGRRNYCSRSCVGKDNINNIPVALRNSTKGIKRGDKYSNLRYHLRKAFARNKGSDITLDDLLALWEKQCGKCPYTGIEITHPSYHKVNCKIKTASLDRIDSSMGYTKDNIQFVSCAINYMKSTMSHEETVELCKTISAHWNKI